MSSTAIANAKAALRAELFRLMKNVPAKSGQYDITSFVTNPSFDSNNTNGWTATSSTFVVNSKSGIVECFGITKSASIYQVLSDMPAGDYTVKVQGFYRNGEWKKALANYERGLDVVKGSIYVDAQSNTKPLKSIFSDGCYMLVGKHHKSADVFSVVSGLGFPHSHYINENNRNQSIKTPDLAKQTFEHGHYWNEMTSYHNDGNLTIGVSLTSGAPSDTWIAIDNFRLFYSTPAPVTITESTSLADDTHADVILKKHFNANELTPLAVPCDIPASKFKVVYAIGSLNNESRTALLCPVDHVSANVPCYVVANENVDEIIVEDTYIAAAQFDQIPVMWDGGLVYRVQGTFSWKTLAVSNVEYDASYFTNFEYVNENNLEFVANLENFRARQFLENTDYSNPNATSVINNYFKPAPPRLDVPHNIGVPVPAARVKNAVVQFGLKSDLSDAQSRKVLDGSDMAYMPNLIPGKTYYYKVLAGSEVLNQGKFLVEGPVRMIYAPSISNIRDLGGWSVQDGMQVRYGLIFRGGEANGLHSSVEEDRQTLIDLGVGAEVDLRSDNNYDSGNGEVGTCAFGFNKDNDYFYSMYCQDSKASNLTNATSIKRFKGWFEFILNHINEDKAVYFHCVWGADRTGLTAVLLQGLLGLSQEQMNLDYELTSLSFAGLRPKSGTSGYGDHQEIIEKIKTYSGSTLRDKFDTYWTSVVGIKQAQIEEFRSIMLYDPLDDVPAEWGIAEGANGSERRPYIITTTNDLDLLAKYVNGTDGYTAHDLSGKYFVLGADIEYAHQTVWNATNSTENNYTSIGGNYNGKDNYFKGTFDGCGHSVKGIRIYKGGADNPDRCQGLFGLVGKGGSVKHVTVSDATISGPGYIAGIVGQNDGGNITDCHVMADVSLSAKTNNIGYCGSISSYTNGTVSGCTSAAIVRGTEYVGGIAGSNTNGTIKDCIYLGSEVSGNSYVGAVSGETYSGSITNCYYVNGTTAIGNNNHGTVTNTGLAKTITFDNGAVPGGTATDYGPASPNTSDIRLTSYVTNNNCFALKLESMSGNTATTTYYSTQGAAVTLSATVTAPTGTTLGYIVRDNDNGFVSESNIFTMPNKDVNASTGFYMTKVSYMAADGSNTTTSSGVKVWVLDGRESTLGFSGTSATNTWYVCNTAATANNGNGLNYSGPITLYGNVYFILANGSAMTVTNNSNAINCIGSLATYGQSNGSGKLTVTSSNGCGIHTTDNITINGGKVSVTGSDKGISAGGEINLGWTNTSDFILVNSYQVNTGNMKIADGKIFEYGNAGSKLYEGTVNDATVNLIFGKALTPYGYGGYCGKGNDVKSITWEIPFDSEGRLSTELAIDGIGEMASYGSDGAPWKNHGFTIANIDNGVTSIGTNTFRGCQNLKIILVADESAYNNFSINWTDNERKFLTPKEIIIDKNKSGWGTYCHNYPVSYSLNEGTTYEVNGLSTDGKSILITEVAGNYVAPVTPLLLGYTPPVNTGQNYDNKIVLTAVPATATTIGTTSDIVDNGGTDVIFYGNPGNTVLRASDITDYIYLVRNTTGNQSYVLYNGYFMKADANQGIAAHRCWLNILGTNNVRQFSIGEDEDVDGIDVNVKVNPNDDTWYDVKGRKVNSRLPIPNSQLSKGIYIYNGKKVVVK